VNVASIAGLSLGQGGFDWHGYHAAKYGAVALTRLFEEGKPTRYQVDGVKCMALCPSAVNTPLLGTAAEVEQFK